MGTHPTAGNPRNHSFSLDTNISTVNNSPQLSVLVDNVAIELPNLLQKHYSNLLEIENAYVLNKSVEYYTGVVNLSNHKLTKDEQSLLSHNLKFCPTPPMFDVGQLKQDVDRFFRSASLYLWHLKENISGHDTHNDTDTTSDDSDSDPPPTTAPFQHPKLKPKSMWTPPFPSLLEHVYQLVLRDIFEYKPNRVTKRNLSNGEYKAINSLKNNRRLSSNPLTRVPMW